MPLYYDLTAIRRKRRIHPAHCEVACLFVEGVLRRRSYGDRPQNPDVDELAEDDLTHDIIVCWAGVREWLAGFVAHAWAKHPTGLDDHDGTGTEHGHFVPPLNMIAERMPETVDQPAIQRAARDLAGLVGMKVASGRAKVSADSVFN